MVRVLSVTHQGAAQGAKLVLFLPARHYASAGTSCGFVSVCVCVCLSQLGVLLLRFDESSWFLAWRLLSTSPILYFKEIKVSTEIRVLSSGGNFS